MGKPLPRHAHSAYPGERADSAETAPSPQLRGSVRAMLEQTAIAPVPWEVTTNRVGIAPRRPDVAGETRTVVEEYLLRLTKGDAEHITELFADDVECYVAAAEAAPWLAS